MNTPQRWQQIDRIFAAVLEREPGARAAFLAEACAGDDELRREVESLLAHDLAKSLVGDKAAEEATRVLLKSQTPELNKRIGPYEIVRSLGAGGMGQVYLAHDKRLKRFVAVKLLSSYEATERDRILRFRQEALAASALNHPNILTIHEIGEFEGDNFIATEFVDGQTLQTKIENGPMSAETAVDIAIQVTSALSAAHTAGIVHRDIKPANIMVRADGLVKVLDFGIAKYAEPTGGDDQKEPVLLTIPGAVIGTAAYMSPEQARGNTVDPRTDIWSIGVILYEMVTGRRPFEGGTALDLMSAVIERNPPSFAEAGLIAPPSLERIVFKALEKNRAARYQSAPELLAELKELKRTLELNSGLPPVSVATLTGAENRSLPSAVEGQTTPPFHVSTIREENQRKDTKNSRGKTVQANAKSRRFVLSGGILALLLVAVAGSVYWSYGNRHPRIESIAVMPFKNESGNGDLDYLSDGITDSLINSLSQLPHLSVKARTSVFRYKDKVIEPQRIAADLSVQAILNGRVVQRGDDVTLYLSLVDAQNGNQLWGERYDRKVADLVTLQREIARDVSQKLSTRLSGEEQKKVTKDYTANVEANQLYLKGRFHVFKLTPPEVQQGITYFQQAIQLDPNYALAYVGLSEANRSLALGAEMTPSVFLPRAKEAAEKAVSLDDALAEAHTSLGASIFWLDRNWGEAESQYKRALELNPNLPDAHVFYAHLLSVIGRHTEALAEIKRARELDPYSPFVNALEGQFLIYAGKPDEALIRLRDTFELAPGFWFPHLFASMAYLEKGMFVNAITEARRAQELSGAQTLSLAVEGYALAKLGKLDEARTVLDKLLDLSKDSRGFVPPYHIALVYNGLGERDQAFAWLQRALEEHDPKLAFLKVDTKWNNLRDDSRFVDLMRRVGFDQ